MNRINFGVIGIDGRGIIGLFAHSPEKGRYLMAGSTLNPDSVADTLKAYNCTHVTVSKAPRDVLERDDIHAVFICTPDFLHEQHALEAIERGKAVYLEKPMAISVEGCDRIIHAAKANDVKVYVGHNMRFFPVIRKMKELVDSGRIGKLQAVWCRHFVGIGGDAYFKDWHSTRKNTHGLLLQKGAHDIDVIHWLAGAYTSRVVGMGKLSVYDKQPRRSPDEAQPRTKIDRNNWPPTQMSGFSPEIDVEDHNMILMHLSNGVQACYAQCHYTPDNHRNYTLIGTEGRIENYGCVSHPDNWATVHLWNRRTGYSEQGHEVFRIPDLEGGHGGADPLVIDDFFRYLQTGQSVGATPWDARMSIATGYFGTESIRNGNIPYDIC